MKRASLVGIAVVCCWLASGRADAQTAAQPGGPTTGSGPWIVIGGGSTTLLGDCTDCEGGNYLHTGSVRANVGGALNARTDLGAEIMWVPETLRTGDKIKVIFVMGGAQFRPWTTRGFFLNTAIGMAFLRNWLDVFEAQTPPIRSKAFALGLGAGWEWRTRSRFGMQIYGSQHVAALGDLQTSDFTAQNVVGNFWSVGAALVIR